MDAKREILLFCLDGDAEEMAAVDNATPVGEIIIDSLDYVDVRAHLCKSFGLDLDLKKMRAAKTLGELCAYVESVSSAPAADV